MKNITVRLTVSRETYEAAKQFMEEKKLDIDAELSENVQKFYRKYVPIDVRKYIERNTAPEAKKSKLDLDGSPDSNDFGS